MSLDFSDSSYSAAGPGTHNTPAWHCCPGLSPGQPVRQQLVKHIQEPDSEMIMLLFNNQNSLPVGRLHSQVLDQQLTFTDLMST